MLKVSNWGEFKSLQETNIHKKKKKKRERKFNRSTLLAAA